MYRNKGNGSFENVTAGSGVNDAGKSRTAAWGDYDQDGYLDLYVVNFGETPDGFYYNNGDGTFRNVSSSLDEAKRSGAGTAASFIDYDNDGDLDLLVVNDASQGTVGNVLWRNDRRQGADGTPCVVWCWTDVSEEVGFNDAVESTGVASGDYDNDGDLELFIAHQSNGLYLLQNQLFY